MDHHIAIQWWVLTGGLLHLVHRGGDWTGPQPTQAPGPSSQYGTKCNSLPINGQCTNVVLFDVALWLLWSLWLTMTTSVRCVVCNQMHYAPGAAVRIISDIRRDVPAGSCAVERWVERVERFVGIERVRVQVEDVAEERRSTSLIRQDDDILFVCCRSSYDDLRATNRPSFTNFLLTRRNWLRYCGFIFSPICVHLSTVLGLCFMEHVISLMYNICSLNVLM